MDFEPLYSAAARRLKPSIIRKLLGLVQKGDVISLAGGTPDASLFPTGLLAGLAGEVIDRQGELALQYGETAGWRPLRSQVAEWLRGRGIACTAENILITSGSQQGIDLLGRVFLDPGDSVAVEDPSYLGGLLVFQNFDARVIPLPTGADGLDMAGLVAALDGAKTKPKFVYLVPTYQNPSGYTMPAEQRKALCALARERDLLLVEDDPYGEICFEGGPVRSLKSFDTSGHVAYLGSFSKIGVPGFRLGWVCAQEGLIARMTMAKETADVCANVFSQAIAAEYFKGGHLPAQLELLRRIYKGRRDAMLQCLEKELPAGVEFNRPGGGFFIWLKGPQGLDTTALFERALQAGVAYVPGDAFFAAGGGAHTLRLTFVAADIPQITEGVRRLAGVLHGAMKERAA